MTHLAPVFQADLENFSIVDCRDLDQIQVGVDQQILVLRVFNKTQVVIEVVGEEEGQVVDELLIFVVCASIGSFDICIVSACALYRSQAYLPVDGGTMRFIHVMTTWNKVVNLPLYSGPILRPAISERHLSVTFLNSGTSRN